MRRGALAAALVLLVAGMAEGQFPVSNLLEPTPKPGTVRRPATTQDGGAGAFTEKGQEPPEAPADEDGRKKLPSQIASLDVFQGTARDRLVLYDDGTVSLAETRHGDKRERRRTISAAERILVSRVLAESASVPKDWSPSRPTSDSPGRRRAEISVSVPGSDPRTFAWDDLVQLPLAYGRVRGAMEDLLQRFRRDEEAGPPRWDAKGLKEGTLLRRRSDAKWFRVVRDDRLSPYFEIVEDAGARLERMFLTRQEVPRVFDPPRGMEGS